MIAINNLHKSFGKLKVLEGVNIDALDKGIFAVLGPNGSGKTTLIKSILGMVIPDSGSIRFNNQEIIGQWQYRDQLSYMPQIANFPPNLKVKELIKMIKEMRGGETSEQALIALFSLESALEKNFSNLSGGTKQKVNILLTFMFDSPLIILDEPTTGLDPLALVNLKELIRNEREKGKTIIITSHIMSFVDELSDRIVFLLEGHIHFNGTVGELKEQTGKSNLELAIAQLLKETNA